MPRHRVVCRIALVFAAALAAAVGGCSNKAQVFQDSNEGGWFSKPIDVFSKPDWAKFSDAKTAELRPRGPVGPDDLVGADGRCVAEAPATSRAAAAQPVPAAEPPADAAAPVAANPGDGLQGGLVPGAPPVIGGIALGMTECQAVQRAGVPGNVNISAGDKGERKVMLTYLSGPWPGIYHFADGRLKEIARAPLPPEPPKAPPKKKIKKLVKKPKTAATQ